jgi:SIT4-associating protein SAP185/190
MFWRFGGYASISTIDSLLEKPDVTVDELLDESDLIQELKSQNAKLIEFLRDENVLDRLLQYTTLPRAPDDEPSPDLEADDQKDAPTNPLTFFAKNKRRSRSKSIKDLDEDSKEEKQRTKYAYVACEVLSCDVWSIAEALLENRECMLRFWRYLKRDSPLDPIQATYFTRVNESLLDKKPDEMIEFFKSIPAVVHDMLRHVDCPTIMDLLLKIISLERHESGHGIIDWLQSQNLIPLLLANLSPEHEASTQTSAGDFLKAIIAMSANATAQDSNVIGPNELTRQLVSEECVNMLLKDMLRGGNPLTVGVGIVIEVIRKNNSDYDLPENQSGPVPRSSDPIYLGTLLRLFAENIPNFMKLIQEADSQKKELKVAFGSKIEPLGFDRFKTCEIMAELLHCSNMQLLNHPGSDRDVKARDAERTRLKSEGKLLGYNDASSALEFGTSVDSSGFHHARAPSFGDVTLESKRLEVSNSTEEDFENVMASDAVEDDKIDFDEKPALNIDESIKEIDAIAAGDAPEKPSDEPNSVDSPTRSELAEKLKQATVEELPEAPDAPKKDLQQIPKPRR